MNVVSIIMLVFALLGALDRIFGNRFGIGKEFEKGFLLVGPLALSVIGMVVLSPALANLLAPFSAFVYDTFKIDPSIIPASLFANDMGGASLATQLARDTKVGSFNALVVSSMMGATVCFSIPLALTCVKKEKHKPLFMGLLCGIVTIPVGCFVAGLICNIPVGLLLLNLLPLIIFALIIAVGILFAPNAFIKIFNILGIFIKIVITLGLMLGILKFLTGIEPIKGLAPLEDGAKICFNAAVVMSGAFPLLFILSKLLAKPIGALERVLKINETSTMGFISTLSTNISTFEMMNDMDNKGVMLNSAFLTSASFVFAGHLAFTLAFDSSYLYQVICAKLISGICALLFSILIYKKVGKLICDKED